MKKKLIITLIVIIIISVFGMLFLGRKDTIEDNDITDIDINTELLISFSEALEIFAEGKESVVTDVETGVTYTVRRITQGYTTIADVETLTADDTEKLLSTTGGTFNMRRRAIIVNVDGIEIAASISPFVHSGRDDAPFGAIVDNRSGAAGRGINLNSIRDNNMEGVIDIYFYNSLIPILNRVDERHQEMVLKAAQERE